MGLKTKIKLNWRIKFDSGFEYNGNPQQTCGVNQGTSNPFLKTRFYQILTLIMQIENQNGVFQNLNRIGK